MMRKNRIKTVILSLTAVFLITGCADAASQGVKSLRDGDYTGALSQFQEAVDSGNADEAADGYQGMGMTYYETGDYAAALEAFQNALDRGAEQTVQLYNLAGVCAMQTEDYETALGYIQAGLALADTASGSDAASEELLQEMRYNEIVCYEQQADWDNAKQKITEYLEEYPDDEAAQKEADFLQTR